MNSCIVNDNGEYLVELEYVNKFSLFVRIKKLCGTHILLNESDVSDINFIDKGGRYDVFLKGRKLATNLSNISGFHEYIRLCNKK